MSPAGSQIILHAQNIYTANSIHFSFTMCVRNEHILFNTVDTKFNNFFFFFNWYWFFFFATELYEYSLQTTVMQLLSILSSSSEMWPIKRAYQKNIYNNRLFLSSYELIFTDDILITESNQFDEYCDDSWCNVLHYITSLNSNAIISTSFKIYLIYSAHL